MKKLVMTAFQPFGGHDLNSSALVLERIRSPIGSLEVSKLLLPVEYGNAFEVLQRHMDAQKPDFVICMGQAGGRKHVCLERIAININSSASPDNSGKVLEDSFIEEKGREAYFSNLPLMEIRDGVASDKVRVAYSAGTYVCNNIFYLLMRYIEQKNPGISGGFIHLPYTEHFGNEAFISLEEQAGLVERIAEELVKIHG